MSRADSFNDIQLIMMFTVSQLGLIKNMEIKRSGVSTILREGCFFLCFFYFKFSKVVFFLQSDAAAGSRGSCAAAAGPRSKEDERVRLRLVPSGLAWLLPGCLLPGCVAV